MNKKKCSILMIIAAVLIIACPFVIASVFQTPPKHIFRVLGIQYFLDEYWFFVAGIFLFVACCLQFPFREEEAWHCECGYDLSYLNKNSRNCPECGKGVQFEWSPRPDTYSLKTIRRIYWAIFLFASSAIVFGLGFLTRLFNSWANT